MAARRSASLSSVDEVDHHAAAPVQLRPIAIATRGFSNSASSGLLCKRTAVHTPSLRTPLIGICSRSAVSRYAPAARRIRKDLVMLRKVLVRSYCSSADRTTVLHASWPRQAQCEESLDIQYPASHRCAGCHGFSCRSNWPISDKVGPDRRSSVARLCRKICGPEVGVAMEAGALQGGLDDHRNCATGSKSRPEAPACAQTAGGTTTSGGDHAGSSTDVRRHRHSRSLPTLGANEHLAGSPVDIDGDTGLS